MSQRSPLNARYQKHTKPAGKTRKSAASARPKSKRPASSSSSAKGKAAEKPRRGVIELPPEIRPYRTAWWSLLGVGFVAALVSFAYQGQWLGNILLGVSWFCIIVSFTLDWLMIRPYRLAAAKGLPMPEPKKRATAASGASAEEDGAGATGSASADERKDT